MKMAKSFVIEGCTLKLRKGSTSAPIQIQSVSSTLVKINGKGVYVKEIKFSVSAYTGTTILDGNGTGLGTILASAIYCKTEGDSIVLEGDESAPFTLSGTSSGNPVTDVDTVYVEKAGQSFAKGD